MKKIIQNKVPTMICASFLLIASGLGWYWHHDAEAILDAHMIETREATESGLVETDVKGVIINANTNMFDLCGYTREELIGKDLKDIMVSHARSKHPSDLSKVHAAITVVRCKLLMKDGTENRVVVIARISSGKYIASIIKEELVIDHFSHPSI